MPKLIPVDHDPFSENPTNQTQPVEYDPFQSKPMSLWDKGKALFKATGGFSPLSLVSPDLPGKFAQGGLNAVKQGALPTIGATGGAIAGSFADPFIGPVGTIGGEMLGSAGGELLNQKLGITQPSKTQIALAGAAPGIARGIGPLTKQIVRFIPGIAGTLHEMGAEEARALATTLENVPEQVSTLFKAAGDAGGMINTLPLKETVDALLSKEAGLAGRNPGLLGYLRRLSAKLAEKPYLKPLDFHDEMSRAGKLTEQAMKTEPSGWGGYKRIYSTFHSTLDEAAKEAATSTQSGAVLLKGAISGAKRKFAQESLADHIEKGIFYPAGQEDRVIVQANRILTNINRDPALYKSLTPRELVEIKQTLLRLNGLPRLRPPVGAQYGSGRNMFGAAVGELLGGGKGAAIGILAPTIVSRAVMTKAGRRLMNSLITQGGGTITKKGLGELAAFTAAQFGDPVKEEDLKNIDGTE